LDKTIGFFFSDQKPYKEFISMFDWITIKNKFSIIFLFSQNVIDSEKTYYQILFYSWIVRLHALLHSCLLWQKRNKSLCYRLRANCYFGSDLLLNTNSSFFNHFKKRRKFIKRTIVKVFGNNIGIFAISKIIELIFYLYGAKLIKNLPNLNYIVFPYGGRVNIVQDFLVWYGHKYRIGTLAVQENWDNLSSKTILFQHPDFFATWGKQSSSQLVRIHEYTGRTYEVGSLRINDFYSFRSNFLSKNEAATCVPNNQDFGSNYILLIGTGDAEFDLKIAEVCSRILDESYFFTKLEYTLIYRPHPYSRINSAEYDSILKLPRLVVDKPTMDENNHYRISLIAKSKIVIALYSTVILEAAILNKPILIPSFIDLDFALKTKDFIDLSEHFMGASALEGVSNPDTIIEFNKLIHSLCISNVELKNNAKLLNWFCLNSNTSNAIQDIILNTIN
jgi:hypothetical protein